MFPNDKCKPLHDGCYTNKYYYQWTVWFRPWLTSCNAVGLKLLDTSVDSTKYAFSGVTNIVENVGWNQKSQNLQKLQQFMAFVSLHFSWCLLNLSIFLPFFKFFFSQFVFSKFFFRLIQNMTTNIMIYRFSLFNYFAHQQSHRSTIQLTVPSWPHEIVR